ncbi:MAG TPA: cation transporter [Solirubrobacteraceae bacterium]|nr:cation transporter [Solirubrobacteraceae bacterium]
MIDITAPVHELPPEQEQAYEKARKLEWFSLAYLATAIAFVYVALGSSQAMKAAWVEDILSLLPPIAFLVANRIRYRRPTERFPWGYHRAISVAYLLAAGALLLLGTYVLVDSLMKLVLAERPPIGVFVFADVDPWAGWVMLAALAYTGIPPVFLGRAKLKLARQIHDKVLYADAEMNRADWMTAGAAALGILGIGMGLWWADAVAGAFISLDIVRDGWRNLKAATADLMDSMPRTYDDQTEDPIVAQLHDDLLAMPWVQDARVRLRELGHVYAGEAFVVPADGADVVARANDARLQLMRDHWKLHDIVIVPVSDDVKEGAAPSPPDPSGTAPSRSAR